MAELSPDERGDRLFLVWRPRGSHYLRYNPPSRAESQQGSAQHGLRRHGDFLKLALPQHVARGARVGFAQFAFDSEFPNQPEQRFRALKTLRPGLEKESILGGRADQSAGAIVRFEQRYVRAELLQPAGAREARNSPADDDDFSRIGHSAFSLLERLREERLPVHLLFVEIPV